MSPTPNNKLIELESVSYRIEGRQILENINLTVQSNEIVSIIGPNGAGKTTLLKIMIGLLEPTQGRLFKQPGLSIGYMPQRLHIEKLFPLTVERFLKLGQKVNEIENMLSEVGVLSVLKRPLYALSGGELQRVLLARALLRNPKLLVLDEPAQGVDLSGQAQLYDLISRVRDKQACAVLLVSHDLNIVMAQTNMVICLNQHICCKGHPGEVTQDPEFMALFGKGVQNLAFYTHRHDHHHDFEGNVLKPEKKDD